MYDLTNLRNWLIAKLYEYVEIPIVPQNSADPQPPKPFYTYNFISPYIPEPAFPAYTLEDKTIDGESWLAYHRWELPTITISLNAYANDLTECWQKALVLRQYFAIDGYMDLKQEGVIVATKTAVEDRAALLNDMAYEYRAGFDAILRVVSHTSRLIETIDEVRYSVNEEEGQVKE